MPLSAVLDDLRRRLRRVIAMRAVCWGSAVMAGGILVMAAADAVVHLDSPALRLFCTLLSVLLGLGIVAIAWLRLRGSGWDNVTLALLVERLRPEYRDRLASAAALAEARNDAPSESATARVLHQRLVHEADAQLAEDEFASLVDRRSVMSGGAVAVLVLAVVAGWMCVAPARAFLAFERQLTPLSAPEWPRTTDLVLLNEQLEPLPGDVLRCLADQPLTLYVWNRRGELPDDLQLVQAATDGPQSELPTTRTALRRDGAGEIDVAVVSWTPEDGTTQIRATGGDDQSMPWQHIEATPAPRLEEFHIRVEPPAYSGLPIQEEDRASGHLEGLIGSRATVRARSNIPLASVTFHHDGEPARTLPLTGDGLQFEISLELSQEGRSSYWFELTDAYGLSAVRPVKYEVRGRLDQPPQVQLKQPAAELTATSTARLPLEVVFSDDLGVGTVTLFWSRRDDGGAPDAGPEATRGAWELWPYVEDAKASDSVEASRVETVWEISTLRPTSAAVIEYSVEATDRKAPDPQRTSTENHRVRIVTAEEKRREIDALQGGIAELLKRALDRHEASCQTIDELHTQWDIAATLHVSDRDALLAVDRDRRQLVDDLTDRRAGLTGQIETIRDQLLWNRLDDAPTRSRMQRLSDHVRDLVDRRLPAFGVSLAASSAAIEPANTSTLEAASEEDLVVQANPFTAGIDATVEHQAVVRSILNAMLLEMQHWKRATDLSRELDGILASQRRVHEQTSAIGRQTVTLSSAAIPPDLQAELAKNAERQRRLAASVESLNRDVARDASEGERVAPNATAVPAELASGAVAGQMERAADYLAANQIGQALAEQEEILRSLTAAAESTTQPDQVGPLAQLELLKQIREAVTELQRQQSELWQELAALRPLSADAADLEAVDRLQRQQGEFADRLQKVAATLRQQWLGAAADAADRGAAQAQLAADAIEAHRGEQVDSARQQLERELERLIDELDSAEAAARQRQRLQALAELSAQVTPLTLRQEELIAEVDRFDTIRREAGRFLRSDLKRLQATADTQRSLRDTLDGLIDQAADTPLIEDVLNRAAGEMRKATERLDERLTDNETRSHQQAALRHLQSLSAALERSPPNASAAGTHSPSGEESSASEAMMNWVEISLLRELQSDLNQRAQGLRQREMAGEDPAVLQPLRVQLGTEQSELGSRMESILERLHSRRPGNPSGTSSPGAPQ
ncbi:MAG: hypothetical protein KDA75_08350 [Planctomycetaceae bacterium]|nr:hypothetical protein [Planctomycetaceae bacterium]